MVRTDGFLVTELTVRVCSEGVAGRTGSIDPWHRSRWKPLPRGASCRARQVTTVRSTEAETAWTVPRGQGRQSTATDPFQPARRSRGRNQDAGGIESRREPSRGDAGACLGFDSPPRQFGHHGGTAEGTSAPARPGVGRVADRPPRRQSLPVHARPALAKSNLPFLTVLEDGSVLASRTSEDDTLYRDSPTSRLA